MSIDAASQGILVNIFYVTLYHEKLELLDYIYDTDSVISVTNTTREW